MLVKGLEGKSWFPQFSPIQGWNLGEEAWSKASMRVLFVFPSEMGVRSVSATHQCLYNIIKEKYGDDVFVDIWMKPYKYNQSTYEKNCPYITGFFSHHTWEDFDVVGFSLAITMAEFVETAVVMHKAGIPVYHRDRISNDRMPLVIAGGVALDNSSILNNVLDICMLGLGERNLPLMVEVAFKYQAQFGSVGKAKEAIIKELQMHTGFYNPRLYHYTHKVVDGHWESTYDSCDVPELQYIKPDVSLPASVIGVNDRQLKLSTPGGAHKVSLQSSFGCQGQNGVCNFCHEASMYGAWRERGTEDLHNGIALAKKSSMGEGFSFFSFNGNFRGRYVDDLCKGAEYFNKVGSINIRIDSLAGSIGLNGDNNYIHLLKQLGTTSIACLHGSTLVETKRGLIPISEVKVGDEVVSLAFNYTRGVRTNPTSVWRKVTHVLPRGKKELYKFTTHDNHSIIATLDHVIPTCDCQRIGGIHDVPVGKLIGKRVMVRENILENFADDTLVYEKPLPARCKYQRPEKINPSLALLLGWLMGDGYVSDRGNRFYFGEKDVEAYKKIKEILAAEGVPYSEEQTPGVFGIVQRINVNSQGFTDFVQACGLLGSSTKKSFPKRLYSASTACQLAFLSGYFSADGRCRIKNYLGKKSLCISVSTISPSILNGVATLLTSLGIKNRIEGKPQNVGLGEHDLYTIDLKGNDSFRSFLDNVGFLQSYKQVDSSELGDKRTVYCDTIEKCEFYAVDECWDLTIEGEPYFTANGIYVHNCPIEGLSQRLRNFLNKNLTEQDILTVDKEVFKRRMIRLKHGLIWTGYETREDYQEHEELYKKIIDLRDMQGANTQLQANATWLVHNYGTPLYYKPRKTAAMAWKQFFAKLDGKDFYFYPWMYLSDLGVKLKESSQPKDTIIQQTLQDCPAEFLEDIWLNPIVAGKFENLSTDMVKATREGYEKYGLTPRGQYLEFNPYKNCRQQLQIGFADKCVQKIDGGDYEKFFIRCETSKGGTGSCLRTPATDFKGNLSKCVQCGSCFDIDKENKAFGCTSGKLSDNIEAKSHIQWMSKREMITDYNLMDVKTSLMVNSPSFYYRVLFKINESGRYISKELLVRRWLSKATDFDESLIQNFRTIAYAFHKSMDYEGLISQYTGLEMTKLGFKDSLDLEKFKKIVKKVNDLPECEAIQLVDIQEAQEAGGNNFKILESVYINDTAENFAKFIEHFKDEHRLYEGGTSMPENFAMDFDYKVLNDKNGYRVLYLKNPRWSAVWSDGLKKWTANKVTTRVIRDNIMAVFTQTQDGRLINVVDGKVFEPTGFIHVHQDGNALVEKADAGVDVDGA